MKKSGTNSLLNNFTAEKQSIYTLSCETIFILLNTFKYKNVIFQASMNDNHNIILFFLKSFRLSLILFFIIFTSLQSYKCNKNKIATTQGKQLKLKPGIFPTDNCYLLLLKCTKIQWRIYYRVINVISLGTQT